MVAILVSVCVFEALPGDPDDKILDTTGAEFSRPHVLGGISGRDGCRRKAIVLC